MTSKKDEYLAKLNARIEAQSAELAALKAKLKVRAIEGQAELRQAAERLEQRLDDAKVKARQIAAAGDETWVEIKDSVEEAWDGISASAKRLLARLS